MLVLALALAVVVLLWALSAKRRASAEAVKARAEKAKLERQLEVEHAAYKSEAERLERLSTGTGDERFRSAVDIMRKLSAGHRSPG